MRRAAGQYNYQTIKACRRKVVLTAPYGDILSPGFVRHKRYPNKESCFWVIKAPKDMIIRLIPLRVDIACDDSLDIYELTRSRKRKLLDSICGRHITVADDQDAAVIHSTTNTIIVRFRSNRKSRALGFKLHYSAIVPCGRPFYQPNVWPVVGPRTPHKPWTSKKKRRTKRPKRSFVARVLAKNRQHVIGGTEAQRHSWPWLVAIVCDWAYLCSGTIIHKHWILTAAHCVAAFKTDQVRLDIGKHSVSNFTLNSTISEIILHPSPNMSDLALLRLSKDLEFNHIVSPACLPRSNLRPGTMGFITGWGMTKTEHPSSVLRQAAIPVVRPNVCKRSDWLGDLVKGKVFCAGYADGGVDSCYGDSGGPFMTKSSDVWCVNGVVSFGVEGDCAQPRKPGVYTKVADSLEWIQQTTNDSIEIG
ncbi:hypothetical protein NP493_115g12009 [Ridgeia piscesae]|uniref:Acrosin n=1 Tax=Ridgeia piscesae TaxID=27915 RepID=A0AAD9P6U2_RIDPI|nr:hypothetical protein NP493_115g12009 [Ridgeia piscesae]